MKLFLENVGSLLSSYTNVRINRNDETAIKNACVNFLGLQNINQLRDRYEGQAFLDKTLKNVGGLIACLKELQIDNIKVEDIDLSDFRPIIKINDKNILVNVFNFGTLPTILDYENIETTIFVIQKETLNFLICGYAEPEYVKKYLSQSNGSSSCKNLDFTGFGGLSNINTLIENK